MEAGNDQRLMRRAIQLAQRRQGTTWPNPVVGCVIAAGGVVLAEAATGPGGASSADRRLHAEEQALLDAGAAAAGATAFITLEPCAERSSARPSCTERLIVAGIARVAVACPDPSPLAAGRGVERLRAAAIVVEMGLLADEAAHLYTGYRRRLATGRPLVEAADAAAGFDAPFEPAPDESLAVALQRYGDAGYTRLWVQRDGILERNLRDEGLLN